MPSFDEAKYRTIILESETGPLKGQNNRSSYNYDFSKLKKGKLLWILPPEVTIDIKNDHRAATDNTVFTGITNGVVKNFPEDRWLYVANPKGTSGLPSPFEIVVRVID